MIRIVIGPVPFDFTPKGKRRVRLVPILRGGRLIRWYVGGRRYRTLAVSETNLELSRDWVANAGAPDNLPQKYVDFA